LHELKELTVYFAEHVLEIFVNDGGIDLLIYFINNSPRDSVFIALQTLADLAVKDSTLAVQIEQKGIKPSKYYLYIHHYTAELILLIVQMASRAYLGALVNKNLKNDLLNKPSAFLKSRDNNNSSKQSVEMNDDVFKYMSFSFHRARDRLSSMLDSSLNVDQRHFSLSAADEEDVVIKLWELLKEHKDLDKINTENLKDQLRKEFTTKLAEQKQFVESQIDRIVGQMELPSKITDCLYLGSEWNSSNLEELTQLGVTHILNLSAESPNYFPNNFTYKNIRIERLDPNVSLSRLFEEVFGFIDECREPKRILLVHSHLGVSRSAAFVIAYLMKSEKWALSKAFKFVKDRRPIIQISRKIMRSLMDLELGLGFESSLGVSSPQAADSDVASPNTPSYMHMSLRAPIAARSISQRRLKSFDERSE
jgi:protein-tyrosine phosphatase